MSTSSKDVDQRLVIQAKQDITSGILQSTHISPEEITPAQLCYHACRLAAEGRLPYDIVAEALEQMLKVRGYLTP